MRTLSEFTIPYLGLSNGTHHYNFELDTSFFASFEKSGVAKGQFEMKVSFDKQDRMIVLSLEGVGYIEADCDRCLADIQVPISFVDQVILKVEEKPIIQKDEVYYLEPGTSHVDLSPYLHEVIHLHFPIKNVRACSEEGHKYCDQEVLKSLDPSDENKKVPSGGNPWNELGKLNLE